MSRHLNFGDQSIGRITTSGLVSSYTGNGIDEPFDITTGPDGALWFVNDAQGRSSIGRITTDGAVTNYQDPRIHEPRGIALGPDGALWFTNFHGNTIGKYCRSESRDLAFVGCTWHFGQR